MVIVSFNLVIFFYREAEREVKTVTFSPWHPSKFKDTKAADTHTHKLVW